MHVVWVMNPLDIVALAIIVLLLLVAGIAMGVAAIMDWWDTWRQRKRKRNTLQRPRGQLLSD